MNKIRKRIPMLKPRRREAAVSSLRMRAAGREAAQHMNPPGADQGSRRAGSGRDPFEGMQKDGAFSGESYRSIFENAVEGIFQATRMGRFIRVNPTMARIFGYESPDEMKQSLRDIRRQFFADPADFDRAVRELQWSGQVLNLETQNRRRDGTLIWTSLCARAVRDSQGAVRYYEGFVTDITQHKQVEIALQDSLDRYQDTLDHMLEGCQIIGFDYHYIYVNEAAARHGRQTREALLGHSMTELYPGIEQTEIFASLRRCMEERVAIQIENEFVYPDGARGWFELSMQPAAEGVFILSIDITSRKQAEFRVEHQLQNVAALRTIDVAIAGSLDMQLTMNVALEQVVNRLEVDAADILLLDPQSRFLRYASGRGFRSRAISQSRIRLGEGIAGRSLLEQSIVHIPNLEAEPRQFPRGNLITGEDFVSYYGAPLIAKGQVKGFLEVYQRTALERDLEWQDFLEALAGQIAIAVDSAQLFIDLQRSNLELNLAYDRTIEGWSHALDLRDRETEGHTLRVTEMTVALAREMGFEESQIVHIRRGAMLHDIGKMGIPDNILFKPDKLTQAEREIMRNHPTFAYKMLSPIQYLHPALDIPYCHHEKWNGNGYPRGLKGEEIPLVARVFSVADVWDALRSDRPYRQGWAIAKTRLYIQRMAGIQFDPSVVAQFLRLTEDGDEKFRERGGALTENG
ncbi:MAG: HD domain-containing phosphohydrolase [Bacteroidota bacterium]